MATPDFVLALREKVGHAPLWMSGVTAVVVEEGSGALLLVRRADTDAWTPVTGIIDPGEEPAVAGAREVFEEAGIIAQAERLVDVRTLPPITYANGDQAQFLDLCFLFTARSGQAPYPADGENEEAIWADPSDLPALNDRFREQIALALSGEQAASFRR